MKKYKYEVEVPANSQNEADEKMQLALAIVNKLNIDETRKAKEFINNPVKLAFLKERLG